MRADSRPNIWLLRLWVNFLNLFCVNKYSDLIKLTPRRSQERFLCSDIRENKSKLCLLSILKPSHSSLILFNRLHKDNSLLNVSNQENALS